MLERDTNRAWVAGVGAGLAEQLNFPVVFIRLFFVASFFLFGFGLALYAWLWAGMPANDNQIHINFT
jgi:phage shock protein PspC (stress-responsive transcriptional regulator)